MAGSRRLRRIIESQAARPVLLIVAVLGLWELGIRAFHVPPYLIPAPRAVMVQLVEEWPKLWRESLVTTYATIGGFALSVALGLPMAVAIAYSRLVESVFYPILAFSQSVPKIAIAPLFVVWFGFGILPKVIAAFLLGFFPVVVATVMGLKSVEPDMIDLAQSMKASRPRSFSRHASASMRRNRRIALRLSAMQTWQKPQHTVW